VDLIDAAVLIEQASPIVSNEEPAGGRAIVDHCRMSDSREWTAQHFSQANPAGEDQGDVPALLRRVADTLGDLGEVEVLDLVLHNEITSDGDWPSIIVYFTRPT
jgi:hypothetical protein